MEKRQTRRDWGNCFNHTVVRIVSRPVLVSPLDVFRARQVLTSADGYRYEGEWRDNLKHGRGKCVFPNGDEYEGEFELDKAAGQGVFTRPNGNRYEGSYRDDKSNGWGVYTFATGDRFEGQWRDGLKTGSGTITWADGRKFEGTFSLDCPVSGELTELDGSVHSVVYDGKTTFGRGAEPVSKVMIVSAEEARRSAKPRPPPPSAPPPAPPPAPRPHTKHTFSECPPQPIPLPVPWVRVSVRSKKGEGGEVCAGVRGCEHGRAGARVPVQCVRDTELERL